MEKEFLRMFLGERAIELHKEYVEECRLRLSILGKSGYDIEGKSYPELCRARLGDARGEILTLSREVYLHEMYFDSFCAGGATSAIVKRCYHSEASFLYKLERLAMSSIGGFLVVSRVGDGVEMTVSAYAGERLRGTPILALDICEHAYFLDYGFDKLFYVRAALSRLDLSKIDKN